MPKIKKHKPDKKTDTKSKSRKRQYHPAFGAALKMEFIKEKDSLNFDIEYPLNMKPLLVDCLIVKKENDRVLENEIGRFFKKYNIVEYKSEMDSLSIDTVSKVQGYAHLYKAYSVSIDGIKFDDISVTLIRESKPQALFKYFDENGYRVLNKYSGIYYIENGLKFQTQVIVGKELNSDAHEWLHLLSGSVTKREMARAIEYSRNTKSQEERKLIDAIFSISMEVNRSVVEELIKGDDSMCQALMEIMKPEIDEIRLQERRETAERVEKETTEHAIRVAVEMLRSLNLGNAEIKEALQKNYSLSEEETLYYLK